MTDTMTSQIIDLSSWGILYISAGIIEFSIYETYSVLHMTFLCFFLLMHPQYSSYTQMASVGTLLT
jgi:hypothetical protein